MCRCKRTFFFYHDPDVKVDRVILLLLYLWLLVVHCTGDHADWEVQTGEAACLQAHL
jgi:hypothetical protein